MVSLGPGPVIIPLDTWTQDSITALYNATTQDSFNDAFEAFVAEDAHITVNGKHVSRSQYKAMLQDKPLEQSAEVSFSGSVVVPQNENEPASAGSVGLFYKATIYEKIKIFGADAAVIVTSSLNVMIRDVEGVDDRRAFAINQVVLSEPAPVRPPTGGVILPASTV